MFTKLTKTTSSYRYRLIRAAYRRWLKPKSTVLDIGCGNGIITKLLLDEFSLKVTGCDVKNYLIYDIPFVKINHNKLPNFKRKFDAVLLNDVLHHIPGEKQKNLILFCLRIAKKILIFEAKPTLFGKITDIILNKYHYGDLNVPLSFRNVADWKVLFKRLSIKSKIVVLKRPFWYPFSHIAILLQKA